MFGPSQNSSLFGKPAGSSLFGGTSTTANSGSTFGQTNTGSSLFGKPAGSGGSVSSLFYFIKVLQLFGSSSQNKPTFGASSTFGGSTQPSGGGLFGSTQASGTVTQGTSFCIII